MEKSLIYDPKKLYIHSLQRVLPLSLSQCSGSFQDIAQSNDPEPLINFCQSVKTKGFAFIRLPPQLVEQIDMVQKLAEQFFAKDQEYKKKFFKKPIFGYSSVGHKESFRLLTGSRLSEHIVPSDFSSLNQFIHTIDRLMYDLCRACSPWLFPNILSQGKKHDISLFDARKPWAMFDIARYFNDGTRARDNCEEHYDPGLFSIHLRSTERGLQLKDENGQWINPPRDPGIAIIWTGNAAHTINPLLPRCVHRVVNVPGGGPRIGIWHEVCTSAQEHRELLDVTDSKTASVNPSDKTVSVNPSSKTVSVNPSGKTASINPSGKTVAVNPLIHYDEGKTGIPMSKSMSPGMSSMSGLRLDGFTMSPGISGSSLDESFGSISRTNIDPSRRSTDSRLNPDKKPMRKFSQLSGTWY